MLIELTHLSAVEYENIVYGNMTPAMAADYLRNGQIVMRSFADTLTEMYPAPDLFSRLTDFFLSVTPGASPQSISKKIRNWITGKNHPAGRDDIFKIAFALHLNEEQLNYLLCLCTDYGIQYRDNREIILSWFLRNEYSYQDAVRFYFSLPPVRELNQARSSRTSRLTHEVRAEFQIARTLEDLRNCYVKMVDYLKKALIYGHTSRISS